MTERHESATAVESPPELAEITPQEAAAILRVSPRTVQRYISRGDLKAVRLPGGRITRIRRSDVEALLIAEASA